MSDMPIILMYKSKKSITVGTSASAPAAVAQQSGRVQAYLVNRSSGFVAFSFDNLAADMNTDPVLPPGAAMTITVHGKAGVVPLSVVGTVADGTFEVTFGAGL